MAGLKGFKRALIGILDNSGNLITTSDNGIGNKGIFSIDAKSSKGTVGANITGMEGTLTAVYGSNQKVDTQYGVPQPQVAFSANDVPYEVIERVLGHKKNDAGGYDAIPGKKPDVAMIIVTNSINSGSEVYVAFYHGTFSRAEENIQTNNANENRVVDSLTYSASANTKNAAADSTFYKDSTDFDFTKMVQKVFPGAANDAISEQDDENSLPIPPDAPQTSPINDN